MRMRTSLWVTTAAAALIAGTTFAGAQTGKTEGGPGASSGSSQMSQGAGQKGAATEQKGGSQKGAATEQKGGSQKGAATEQKGAKPGMAQGKEEHGTAGEKAAGPKGAQTEKSKQPGMAQGKTESTEKKGAETGKGMGTVEKKGTAEKKGAETGKSMGATEKKGTEGRAQTKTQEKSQTSTSTSGGTVQLSSEQKTKVHEVVTKESSARVDNVDFSISVNTVVPRHVRLHVLPPILVEIVPQYRTYRYIIVRDEILIIDPDTFRIVAIIPA
jgi:hypothetical protein